MRYFEEINCFAYKVEDPEAGKLKWRVSVDMGVHSFLQSASSHYTQYLTYYIMMGNDEIMFNRTMKIVTVALDIVEKLEGTAIITDPVYIEGFKAATRDIAESMNEKDSQTLYNVEWWRERQNFLKEIKDKV